MEVQATFKKLPVTVLSGFLGSGKTTLLNHVLNNRSGLKVNDMSEVNIDAAFVDHGKGAAHLSKVEEKLIDLSNGCICCTLREDLLVEVGKLAAEQKFDYLIIESTGISEPMQVAETFTFELADGQQTKALSDVAHLDTMLTMIDCRAFFSNLKTMEQLKDRGEAAGPDDERNVADLLVDQVEFANVIVLNKTDLVSSEELAKVRAFVHKLNPAAKIITSTYANVALDVVLNTGLFNFEQAALGWLKEIRGEHVPETLEYNISSFVFRARRPFHPKRFYDLIEDKERVGSVLRGKGFVWYGGFLNILFPSGANNAKVAVKVDFSRLASRDGYMGEWEKAGDVWSMEGASEWFCNTPEEEWTGNPERIRQDFVEGVGDKRQEIVFIGIDMKKEELLKSLHDCLLTDSEMALGDEAWEEFEDPFDDWEIMFESDDEDEGEEDESMGEGKGEGHKHTTDCKHGHHHGHK